MAEGQQRVGPHRAVVREAPGVLEVDEMESLEGLVKIAHRSLSPSPRPTSIQTVTRFAGRSCALGAQPEHVGRTLVYVMPSTSPRGASYPRADKLRCFGELAALVEHTREKAAS